MTTGYPDSYYHRTVTDHEPQPPLEGQQIADVCIVGAGLAGLTTAWELLKRGKTVAVVESNRVGWGASGRNGGFVSPGWSEGLSAIENKLGIDHARKLFALSVEGADMVRANLDELNIPDCSPISGKFLVQRYPGADTLKTYRDHLAEAHDYHYRFVDRDELRESLKTPVYHHALHDSRAFHFHPLNYCLGLARAVTDKGGKIFEGSPMTALETASSGERVVFTEEGKINCGEVVLCCGGYGSKQLPRIGKAFLPIATYIILTEKLGDRLEQAVATRCAIGDGRRSSDYYRIVDEDRLLWGGRISTRNIEDPTRLATMLKADLLQVYPQLGDIKIDAAWSGLMGYAGHKMPHIAQLEPGLWSCMSFGGHGVNTTAAGARVLAEALCDESDRYRLFEPFPHSWNGGVFGPLAAETVYAWLRLQDRWKERR